MDGFWEQFRIDPRQTDNARMRASDADREIVRTVLGEAFGDGRLTRDEHDDRVGTLLVTRTLGELPPLVDDLVMDVSGSPAAAQTPLPTTDFRERGAAAYRKEVQETLSTLLVVSLITWAIWGFTSAPDGHPWPIYPMLVLIANFLGTLVRREAIVEREVHRLEKKAAKKAAKAARAELETPSPEGGPILGPPSGRHTTDGTTSTDRPGEPTG